MCVNGTLVEDKMRRFKGECAQILAKFSTNSHETDNSVRIDSFSYPGKWRYSGSKHGQLSLEMRRVNSDNIWIQHFPKALDPDPDVQNVTFKTTMLNFCEGGASPEKKNVKKIKIEDFYLYCYCKIKEQF